MNLKNQFFMHVPILPDDDFVVAFYKVAPYLKFKSTEHVARFLFEEEERDSLCDRIVDLFEDELDAGQSNRLMDLIDSTFDIFSKTQLKAYHKLSGGLSDQYHAASQQALKTIKAHLNERMMVACAWFVEGVFAVRDKRFYDEPLRPNII